MVKPFIYWYWGLTSLGYNITERHNGAAGWRGAAGAGRVGPAVRPAGAAWIPRASRHPHVLTRQRVILVAHWKSTSNLPRCAQFPTLSRLELNKTWWLIQKCQLPQNYLTRVSTTDSKKNVEKSGTRAIQKIKWYSFRPFQLHMLHRWKFMGYKQFFWLEKCTVVCRANKLLGTI